MGESAVSQEPRTPAYRPLVPAAVAFAAGLAACEYLDVPPATGWGLAVAAALAWPLARAMGLARLAQVAV
ncbi:MAG: hypothetical protein ACODAJ_09625, partial [Planctomycetota bacterium]